MRQRPKVVTRPRKPAVESSILVRRPFLPTEVRAMSALMIIQNISWVAVYPSKMPAACTQNAEGRGHTNKPKKGEAGLKSPPQSPGVTPVTGSPSDSWVRVAEAVAFVR